jgi:hypothetical protein
MSDLLITVYSNALPWAVRGIFRFDGSRHIRDVV